MNTYISKLGVSLTAFALVVAPILALAQTTPVVVSITSPSNNVQVTVGQTVSFDANGTGGNPATYTYSWDVDDNRQVGVKSFTHTYNTTGTKNIDLRITDGRGNTGTASITVNVVNGTTPCSPLIVESPAASAPRADVTRITQTSAVIMWTTCEPATSRVVYDTVTHPGQNPAVGNGNYGYAFTTSRNDAKVTQHEVTLTGLNPNTTYYFRVLSAR